MRRSRFILVQNPGQKWQCNVYAQIVQLLQLPIIIYISLALLYMSAAIATVVTVAEILKNNGLAVEKSESLHSHSVIHLVFRHKNFHVNDMLIL